MASGRIYKQNSLYRPPYNVTHRTLAFKMVTGMVDFPTPRPQSAQSIGHRQYDHLNTSNNVHALSVPRDRPCTSPNVHALSEVSRSHGPWEVVRPASASSKQRYKQTDPSWVNPLGKVALLGGKVHVGGWDETERQVWNDRVRISQHRAVEMRTNKSVNRPNSAAMATRNASDRVQRIESAFHQCLADLPEIQRTNPAAFAGLRKLEGVRRRSSRRETAAQATAERLTATWTVARAGKERPLRDFHDRARSI